MWRTESLSTQSLPGVFQTSRVLSQYSEQTHAPPHTRAPVGCRGLRAGYGGDVGIIIINKQICFSAPSTLAATSCMCGGEREVELEICSKSARRRGVINGELPTCLLPRIPIQPAGSSSSLRRVARAA